MGRLTAKTKQAAAKPAEKIKNRAKRRINKPDDFPIPKWMECTWRRVPCGKSRCPICGRIKNDRRKHAEDGENPDNPKAIFEDMAGSMQEAFAMIKKHAKKMGIDISNIPDNFEMPPKPAKWPMRNKAAAWQKQISDIMALADRDGEPWVYTELADDLMWYSCLIPSKTYRQLCTKWQMDRGLGYGAEDMKYTRHVLSECFKILKTAFSEIIAMRPASGMHLLLLKSQMMDLEKEISGI